MNTYFKKLMKAHMRGDDDAAAEIEAAAMQHYSDSLVGTFSPCNGGELEFIMADMHNVLETHKKEFPELWEDAEAVLEDVTAVSCIAHLPWVDDEENENG